MTRPGRVSVLLAMFSALAAAACTGDSDDGDGDAGGGGSGGGGPTPMCEEPTAVPCEDAMIQELDFQTDPAPGLVTNDADGAGFVSHIDATAGATGSPPTPTEGYVYARFTAAGLEKVDLDDEAALASMGWDLAFRRYVIRVNSGDSGPSCVGVARLPAGSAYETATAPDAAAYHVDDFYTDDCTLITDGGMASSPATALAGYYSYHGCVQMTGNVYVVRLANGHTVKLTVTGYYGPGEKQQYCEEHGAPASPSGAANFSVRWAFLE
jgi:hypothetical protein